LVVRKSSWFIKNDKLGRVLVGQDGTALYHVLDDADGANTRSFSDAQAAAVAQNGFRIRSNGGFVDGLTWGNILQGIDNGTVGQDGRRNVVRYDSPTIAGFSLAASWGEDDDWGLALTYKNVWGDFQVLGKVGYGENSDENIGCADKKIGGTDCEMFGAAGTIMHVPTGLYVYGGYAQNTDNNIRNFDATAEDTSTMWFIQGGIERKWISLGKTTIFGEYRHDEGGSKLSQGFGGANLQATDLNFAAAGVIQHLDPAAMDLYVVYRHGEGDITNADNVSADLDAFDAVQMGALIQF
jgi:hypothetical protein